MKYLAIDLETTGLYDEAVEIESGKKLLGCQTHSILEIACILLDENFDEIDRKSFVIKANNQELNKMNDFVIGMHTSNGLVEECKQSKTPLSRAESSIVNMLEKHLLDSKSVMPLGNSVHFDVAFVKAQMPKLASYFHYRCLDVSTLKTVMEYIDVNHKGRVEDMKSETHRAMQDIEESLKELKYYLNYVSPTVLVKPSVDPLEDAIEAVKAEIAHLANPSNMSIQGLRQLKDAKSRYESLLIRKELVSKR